MLTIHKYVFADDRRTDGIIDFAPKVNEFTIQLPQGAVVRHVAMQGSVICLWAEVDTEQPMEPQRIFKIGTGAPVPIEAMHYYIGTVFQNGFVWHLYGTEHLKRAR